MAVLVTKPAIEINGDGAMGIEKVAVIDTTPVSTIFPDALLAKFTVTLDELLTTGPIFAATQLLLIAKRGCVMKHYFL